MLAIPSLVIGWLTVEPVLFGGFFGDAIVVQSGHDVLHYMGESWHGPAGLLQHAWQTPVFWLAMAGLATAWFLYLKRPDVPEKIKNRFEGIYTILDRKYYFDDLYINGFAAWGRGLGNLLWKRGDEALIDGVMVNGSANSVARLAGVMRQLQSGYLYTYAFAMIIGLTMFLGWLIWLR
jgi:NADH-quinone oxidoreductase subunit L